MLDGLRSQGSLSEGVSITNGGVLRIIFNDKNGNGNGHYSIGANTVDSRIVALALGVQRSDTKIPTILVTKDINLRIKADALGLPAEDYETDRVQLQDLYTGMMERAISSDKMAAFRANDEFELDKGQTYYPNEYCTLVEEGNPKRTALTKVDNTGTK